jgi:hypothetical protein
MLIVQIFNSLYVSYDRDMCMCACGSANKLLSQYKVAVKLINIRINKNQFSSSQAVACGQTVRLLEEFLQRTVNIPE